MTITTYAKNEYLDHLLGTGAYTAPDDVYLALFLTSGPPTVGGGGTEVSTTGTAYARQLLPFSPAAGTATQSTGVLFVCTGTSYGEVGHYAIYDAVTGGNMLYFGDLDGTVTPDDGESIAIAASAIVVELK